MITTDDLRLLAPNARADLVAAVALTVRADLAVVVLVGSL